MGASIRMAETGCRAAPQWPSSRPSRRGLAPFPQLGDAQDRTRAAQHLQEPRRGEARHLRVHRSLLQPAAAALDARVQEPHGVRADPLRRDQGGCRCPSANLSTEAGCSSLEQHRESNAQQPEIYTTPRDVTGWSANSHSG